MTNKLKMTRSQIQWDNLNKFIVRGIIWQHIRLYTHTDIYTHTSTYYQLYDLQTYWHRNDSWTDLHNRKISKMLKIRLECLTKKNRGHLVSPPLTNVDYRSRSEIIVLMFEQVPYPVWLSCRSKSYPVKSLHRFKVFDFWTIVGEIINRQIKTGF